MAQSPSFHPVYKSMNKPLTIWGAERRLFFLAAILVGRETDFAVAETPARSAAIH
jgi:hypothetical protein